MHIQLRPGDGAKCVLEHPSPYRLDPGPERLTIRVYASVGNGALKRGLWLVGYRLSGRNRAAGTTAGANVTQRKWIVPSIDAAIHSRVRPARLGSFLDFYVLGGLVRRSERWVRRRRWVVEGVSDGARCVVRATCDSVGRRHSLEGPFGHICAYYSTDFPTVNV